MTNTAFEAAAAGGSVDTAVGFPKSREEMYEFYGFIRKQTRDSASVEGGELEFPAGYMFKDVPKWEAEEMDDPVQILLAELDRHNIRQAIVTPYDGPAERALREYPDRFFAGVNVDPNEGMEAVRKLEAAVRELDARSAQVFPAGLLPQVPINDKKFFPIYAKCIELDIPINVCAGVPGPRVPFAPQYVGLIDEVCWFFPELKFVTRHGCEPWADLAVKLLLKWPNLYYSTTAFAPKYYPKEIIDFANTRGADKVMYAGYFPMGLSLERIFGEMPDVPFRDHVWPKFLHDNAARVLGLEDDARATRAELR